MKKLAATQEHSPAQDDGAASRDRLGLIPAAQFNAI